MKINEINKEIPITKQNLNEIQKKAEKEDISKIKHETKKDMVHITESKRESNILDKKINLADIPAPVKLERTAYNKENVKEQELDVALKKLNTNTDITNKGIRFEKDNYYDKIIVRVYNTETGEQIKQIPPQDLLDFAKKSEEIMGILFDKTI